MQILVSFCASFDNSVCSFTNHATEKILVIHENKYPAARVAHMTQMFWMDFCRTMSEELVLGSGFYLFF